MVCDSPVKGLDGGDRSLKVERYSSCGKMLQGQEEATRPLRVNPCKMKPRYHFEKETKRCNKLSRVTVCFSIPQNLKGLEIVRSIGGGVFILLSLREFS
ncbi:unnamed protein product [Brassica napus]|uniref:(rape) hypothetical protein n=1 Tax=Brassica napus TaxID=3708 RepID=A0A816JM48_BRANA|nr:unnamed protein product [Brassica napus]